MGPLATFGRRDMQFQVPSGLGDAGSGWCPCLLVLLQRQEVCYLINPVVCRARIRAKSLAREAPHDRIVHPRAWDVFIPPHDGSGPMHVALSIVADELRRGNPTAKSTDEPGRHGSHRLDVSSHRKLVEPS